LVGLLLSTRPGRRLLRAALRNREVRRTVWTSAGRRTVLWPMLEDDRIRWAAFDALEHPRIRATVLTRIERQAGRAAWPGGVRRLVAVLRGPERRADLRRVLDRWEVRRDVRLAAESRGVRRIVVIARAVGLSLRARGAGQE
jgi:hypothetical protein